MKPWYSLLLTIAVLPACSSGTGKPKVAFVTNNPVGTFWSIAEAGCRAAEAELGVEVVFRKPSRGDAATQKETIDPLLSQRVKALAVSVIDPKNQRSYIDEVAAKVPFLAVDNDAPGSQRLCYIGTNNYLAGRDAGKLVKEALPEGGIIAVFVGQTEPLNARQRRQGLLDELADRPAPADVNAFEPTPDKQPDGSPMVFGKYTLHGTFTDQPDGETKAKANTDDVLKALKGQPKVGLVGLWAYNPPQILAAVEDAKRLGQVQIIGFDEDFKTLDGIAEGHIHGTVVQQPYLFGYESVKIMAALAKGQQPTLPENKQIIIPHKVIKKDNVKEFRGDLEAKLGKKPSS